MKKTSIYLTNREKRSEAIAGFIMIAIPLIGFLVLKIYPILWTFRWSFFSYNGIASLTRFIGLDNFKKVFSDGVYWRTWITTLEFVFCKMPFEIALAMFLAILLNKELKGSGLYRALYYLPSIISSVVTGIIFTSIFTYDGVMNTFLTNIGLIKEPLDWFSKKWTALGMLSAGGVWMGFGINVLYFSAALANVSQEIHESAQIDGANSVIRFFKITLPMIAPVFSIVVLLSLLANLSANEFIISFTGGAPAGQTQTVMSYLTTKFVPGFAEDSTPPLGYGCTLSLITTLLFALLAVAYNKINKKISNMY